MSLRASPTSKLPVCDCVRYNNVVEICFDFLVDKTIYLSDFNMVTIMNLSDDVLGIILEHKIVSIEDIMSFRCTCKRFSKVISPNNVLWRKKFFQRWPRLKKKYNYESINYEQYAKRSLECRKYLHQYLSLMPEKFYHIKYLIDEDINNFNMSFLDAETYELNYDFLMDELDDVFAQWSWTDCNLTQLYYVEKLMTYLKHSYLRKEWQKFTNKSKEQQILEDAVSIVEDWAEGRFSRKFAQWSVDIPKMLDKIADKVMDSLRKECPEHSIFSASAELFTYCKYNNIVDNYWDQREGRQVLDAIRKVLYDELNFMGIQNTEILPYDCGISSTEYRIYFVDYVLHRKIGHFIPLAVIFICVARRLGLRCEIADIPSHFFLKWKPKYNEDEDAVNLYIDLLNRGIVRSFSDCPVMRDATNVDKCPMKLSACNNTIFTKVVKQTTENVLRIKNSLLGRVEETYDLLQLQLLVEPTNLDKLVQLYRHCVTYELNFKGFHDAAKRSKEIFRKIGDKSVGFPLEHIEDVLYHLGGSNLKHVIAFSKIPKTLRTPEERPANIKYAVGMIVSWPDSLHYINNKGVIIGWYPNNGSLQRYKSTYKIDFIFNNQTSSTYSFDQNSWPYYKVLCNNHRGEIYVAEGYIKPPDQWPNHSINNDEIGRYFCEFTGAYYVPNEMLAREYPYDRDYVTQRYDAE